MEILKFENAPAPRKSAPKKSNLKSLAGLATVAAVAVLGSTLAANISLGTGATLEFGQGVQSTAACDTGITLSPKVTFQNGATPQFVLSTVSITGLDSTDQSGASEGCDGKTLKLNAYGNTEATPLSIATNAGAGVTTATIAVKASGTMTGAAGTTITLVSGQNSSNTAVDLSFNTPQATSGAVYKLTLQSE